MIMTEFQCNAIHVHVMQACFLDYDAFPFSSVFYFYSSILIICFHIIFIN